MAFGLKSWIATFALACAVLAVGLAPRPSEFSREVRGVGRTQSDVLGRQVHAAHEWLARLELRDSLLPLARQARESGHEGPLLLVDPDLRRLERIDSAFGAVLPRGDGQERKGTIAVAVVIDTTGRVPGLEMTNASRLSRFLPESTDGQTCLVLAQMRRMGLLRYYPKPRFVLADPVFVVGPCAYYAEFGEPGSQIKLWLGSAGYALAEYPYWSFSAEPDVLGTGFYARVGQLDVPHIFTWPTDFSAWTWGMGWLLGYWHGLLACAAENSDDCRSSLFWRRDPGIQIAPAGAYDVEVTGYRGHPFGDAAGFFLSDVLVDMGSERFARFWSSELSVEEAFAAEMGLSLEDWTMRWARKQLSSLPQRYYARPSGLLFAGASLIIVAACLGGAMAWATRRQVG